MASCLTLSMHLQCFTFCIHVNQTSPHKDIGLTTTLNDLLMNMPGRSSTTQARAFSTPTKGREFGCMHAPVAFVEIFPVPSALSHISHIPISWCSKWSHLGMASYWTLSMHLQCSHILHTCQPSQSPQRHQTCNHCEWADHEQTCHFLSAHKPVYASITRTKVNSLVLLHSCCICWKRCIAFLGCPSFTYLLSFWFHVKMFKLHCSWCHFSHLCYHPWQDTSVLNPECFLCLLMFEIWVPFICLTLQCNH